MPIMRNEYPILFRTEPKHIGIWNGQMQTHRWRALKLHGGFQALRRSQDILVEIVVRLKPDLHPVGFGALRCRRRALSAAPFGYKRAISRLKSASVASL